MKMHLVMDFPCTKKNIYFSKVGPNKGKAIKCQIYQVKKYIYAWINVSFLMKLLVKDRYAWIGYVAVDIDEGTRLLGRRDILICWRGTYNIAEWEKILVSCKPIFKSYIRLSLMLRCIGDFIPFTQSQTQNPKMKVLEIR